MYHNQFCKLELPVDPDHKEFISLFKGLKTCPLAYGISADPVIHTTWIHELWKNANGVEETKGMRYIRSEVAKQKFTIQEEYIRRILRIGDQATDSIIKFKWEQVYLPFIKKVGYEAKLSSFDKKYFPPYWKVLTHIIAQCLSDLKGSFDSLRLDWLGVVKALINEMDFNFSRVFFNIMFNHAGVAEKDIWALYPRFVQLLLNDKLPTVPNPVYEVDKDADGKTLPAKEPHHVVEVKESAMSALKDPKGKSYRYTFKDPWSKFGRFKETEPIVTAAETSKGKRKATDVTFVVFQI